MLLQLWTAVLALSAVFSSRLLTWRADIIYIHYSDTLYEQGELDHQTPLFNTRIWWGAIQSSSHPGHHQTSAHLSLQRWDWHLLQQHWLLPEVVDPNQTDSVMASRVEVWRRCHNSSIWSGIVKEAKSNITDGVMTSSWRDVTKSRWN